MYAHVTGGVVDQVGRPPRLAYDGSRWWDLRSLDPSALAACGWLPVTETPRPDDTDTGTHDGAVVLVDGLPVRVWTFREWTAEELAAQAERAAREARYATHEAILDATAALMADAHADGAAWVQPTGAHDAYALGITVTHGGKTWESLIPANVWPPGVSGWREVVAEGHPAWVQPTGAHDAYALGAQVTHNGQTWTSTVGSNVWAPGVYGWSLTP